MKYFPVPQDKVGALNNDSLLSTSTSLLGQCAFLARAAEENGREEKPRNLFVLFSFIVIFIRHSIQIFTHCLTFN